MTHDPEELERFARLGRAVLLRAFKDLLAGNGHGFDVVHWLHSDRAALIMTANGLDPAAVGKAIERVENGPRLTLAAWGLRE